MGISLRLSGNASPAAPARSRFGDEGVAQPGSEDPFPPFAQEPEREGIVEDAGQLVPEEVPGAAYGHEFGGPASVGLDLAGC